MAGAAQVRASIVVVMQTSHSNPGNCLVINQGPSDSWLPRTLIELSLISSLVAARPRQPRTMMSR